MRTDKQARKQSDNLCLQDSSLREREKIILKIDLRYEFFDPDYPLVNPSTFHPPRTYKRADNLCLLDYSQYLLAKAAMSKVFWSKFRPKITFLDLITGQKILIG